MTEPMSDERLAEIQACDDDRNRRTVRDRPNSAIAHRHELLAEVKRLRGELATLGRPTTEWGIREQPDAEPVEHCGFTFARLKAIAEDTPGGYVTVRTARRGPWRDAEDWELQ